MKVRYLLTALVLVPLITIAVIGCSTPAAIPEPPDIADGWIRINIKDVGSIDYPTDFLELQSAEYKEMAPEELVRVFNLYEADFTLQQVGLNELQPSAFDEYRRVMLQTFYLNLGEEVFRANEKYTMSQKEQDILRKEFEDELSQGFKATNTGLKLVESVSLEVAEVNGMFPLVYTYKRQLSDNPVVLVSTYIFQNYDKVHYLTFSHRAVDEAECSRIYDEILHSFVLY